MRGIKLRYGTAGEDDVDKTIDRVIGDSHRPLAVFLPNGKGQLSVLFIVSPLRWYVYCVRYLEKYRVALQMTFEAVDSF